VLHILCLVAAGRGRGTNRRKERILVDNQPLVQHLSDREDFISLAMFHQQAILAACFSLFGYKIVKAHFNTFDQF
jgi:uncharacterized protein with ACT and thioredoxin-like domain